MRKIGRTVKGVSVASLMVLAACGGGADKSASDVPAVKRGIFTDSPVSGVTYRTASSSGVTGADGEFQYLPGESVTFSIGDVVLGTAPAAETVTPKDLGPVHNDTNPTTVNIARFLQSLDADGNLDNGIQISSTVRGELAGKSINFGKSTADFNDSGMQALFSSLNSKGAFGNAASRTMLDDLSAQYNMRRSLNPGAGPFDGEWCVAYQYPADTGSSGAVLTGSGSSAKGVSGKSPSRIQDFSVQISNGYGCGVMIVDPGYQGAEARITISDSKVTFTPYDEATSPRTGTISSSGAISIPDRSVQCGETLSLPSKLQLKSDGTISGEWSIALPLGNGCFAYQVDAVFNPISYAVSSGGGL